MPTSHHRSSLILGGARSGKSRYAETLTMRHPAPWLYIATAQAYIADTTTRETRSQAVASAQTHGLQLQLLPQPQVAAAPFRNSGVVLPHVHTVQVHDVQVQAEVFWVIMASLEIRIVTRRSGVSGLRTRQMRARRSSCGAH